MHSHNRVTNINGKECEEIKFYVDIVIFAFIVMTL